MIPVWDWPSNMVRTIAREMTLERVMIAQLIWKCKCATYVVNVGAVCAASRLCCVVCSELNCMVVSNRLHGNCFVSRCRDLFSPWECALLKS